MFEVTPRHIAFDVETGALDVSTVPLLSLGMVEFDPFTGKSLREAGITFNLAEQLNERGKKLHPGTMYWWSRQDISPQRVILDALFNNTRNFDAIETIEKWIWPDEDKAAYDKSDLTVWASDLVLDFGPLESMFHQWNRSLPWAFNRRRCLRTLKEFSPWQLVDDMTEIGGTKHDALDDARYCAITASRLLRAHRLAIAMINQQG